VCVSFGCKFLLNFNEICFFFIPTIKCSNLIIPKWQLQHPDTTSQSKIRHERRGNKQCVSCLWNIVQELLRDFEFFCLSPHNRQMVASRLHIQSDTYAHPHTHPHMATDGGLKISRQKYFLFLLLLFFLFVCFWL
jgi:hypothetical protein